MASRWSTDPRQVQVVEEDGRLTVSYPLLLDGVKVVTLQLRATDQLGMRLDVLTEPGFVGLVNFEAWEHPAGGGS
jgi:hypothetical protein